MIKFIFMYFMFLCVDQNLCAAEVSTEGPEEISLEGKAYGDKLLADRKRGTRLWSIPCLGLSRHGYGYGGVFLSRWGTAISWHNPYVACIQSGEPAFTSGMTGKVLNGWMEGWLMAKMERETGTNFTLYGVVGGGLLGFEPQYYSFAKKLVVLRNLIHKKFELYRASIPTTIAKFEEALVDIAREAQVPLPSKARAAECLKRLHGPAIKFTPDNNFYRIQNESVLFIDSHSLFNVARTHKPWDTWTPVHESSGLSCKPAAIGEIFKKLKSHDVQQTMKQKGPQAPVGGK